MRRALLLSGFVASAAALGAAAAQPAETWVGAGGHAPTAYTLPGAVPEGPTAGPPRRGFSPLPAYANQTVRQVVRLSAAATSIRFRFSNEFGAKPLRLGAVHVALAGENGTLIPDTDRVVTFARQESVIMSAGAPVISDTLRWTLPAAATLAVTVHYPDETWPPAHTVFALNAWASSPGQFFGAAALPGAQPARSGIHLSEIDILSPQARRTVVAFGDSVTEGVGSTVGAFRGWPDRLAERLQANAATREWSVVNAGIGSNRLIHDTPSSNAMSRFDRDVLAVPGVSKVIVLLGINDIQYTRRYAAEAVGADRMIAALQQLILRAHARNVGVIGGTIPPFEGSSDHTPEGEAVRQEVNRWIRGSGEFDGVVDFDAALRDPQHPGRLIAAADGGGHLHPNDAGYAMMGNAIDLSLFTTRQQ